jgi:TetR/AcrR family tetracycline transcriptional repressor
MTARKANQPQLSREQIVSAALKLIDEHGLESHSMRQLGAALGVDATSIYHYVPSKNDLYNLIVDEIMSGIDLSIDDPSLPVDERLVVAAHEYRRALLVHPKALPLASTRSLRTAKQLRGVEVLLGIFFDAGFDATESITATDILGTYVLGGTNALAAHITHAEYHAHSDGFDELPPKEFPNMTRVLAQGHYTGFDAEFDRGVCAIVTGLLSLHAADALSAPAVDSPIHEFLGGDA